MTIVIYSMINIIFSISVVFQMGNSSRRYAEVAGRLEPLGADVMMGLIDMGLFKSSSSLLAYAKRSNRAVLPSPLPSIQPRQTSNLQAGTRLPHPPYMPNYMPAFPDPHAYIRTPVIQYNTFNVSRNIVIIVLFLYFYRPTNNQLLNTKQSERNRQFKSMSWKNHY